MDKKLTADEAIKNFQNAAHKYIKRNIYAPVAITDADDLSLGKSLTELIWEAQQEALKNDIRANTVMISKRIAKVNRFVLNFGFGGYKDFPPLICGLEAFVTDELPSEFAFGVVEAPMTQREQVFEDGRKTGYRQGYDQGYEEGINEFAERLKTYYNHLTVGSLPYLVSYHIDQIKKELLKEDEKND